MGEFVSFYNQQGLVPVRQNIEGEQRQHHFNRRSALYRLLGIPPGLLRGVDIIEFGPGSGDNAIYTSSLAPKQYTFVEGSDAGYRNLKEMVRAGAYSHCANVTINHALIEDYQDANQYDLVLCEGLLPGQSQPTKLLTKVASFVRPGGVLVITTATYVSLLADILRRVLFPFFKNAQDEPDMERLITFFGQHLSHLEFVSRRVEDWVIDTIIHPWGKNYEFSMLEACICLGEDFDYLGSSPNFYQNWQWYKEFIDKGTAFNDGFKQQYRQFELSFLNREEAVKSSNLENVTVVSEVIKKLYLCHRDFWKEGHENQWKNIEQQLQTILDVLPAEQSLTQQAIGDYIAGVNAIFRGAKVEDIDFKSFSSFWGRGQQYLSFVRL